MRQFHIENSINKEMNLEKYTDICELGTQEDGQLNGSKPLSQESKTFFPLKLNLYSSCGIWREKDIGTPIKRARIIL